MKLVENEDNFGILVGLTVVGVSLSQQPPPPPPLVRSRLKQYKNFAIATIVTLAIIIVIVILASPIVPIHYTVTKTRTRNFQYSAGLYCHTWGGIELFPPFANVTNQESIGGNFSVTINYWNHAPEMGGLSARLISTFSQSIFINAGITQTFSPPSGWGGLAILFYDYSYSVSAPRTQENYNVTQTEYKSILNLLFGS